MDHSLPTTALPRITQPSQFQSLLRPSMIQRSLLDNPLSDLDPDKTLEAFNGSSESPSLIMTDVTPDDREFGKRALVCCKNIKIWLEELTKWPWPRDGRSSGFELPAAKKKGLSKSCKSIDENAELNSGLTLKFIGCLTESQISFYESRLNEINNALEDLRVDEIKRQILETHFAARPHPTSSYSSLEFSTSISTKPHIKMDDFTAIITATMLQALPRLNKLVRLLDFWSIRLCILEKIPELFLALEDAEVALESGWKTIRTSKSNQSEELYTNFPTLSRESFDVIRNVIQDKVTVVGQSLDFMLNTLESSPDTLPESWLSRMEDIERNYEEWVVAADSKVRKDEWMKLEDSYHQVSATAGSKKQHDTYGNISSQNRSLPSENFSRIPNEVSSSSIIDDEATTLQVTGQKESAGESVSQSSVKELIYEDATKSPLIAESDTTELAMIRNGLDSTTDYKVDQISSPLKLMGMLSRVSSPSLQVKFEKQIEIKDDRNLESSLELKQNREKENATTNEQEHSCYQPQLFSQNDWSSNFLTNNLSEEHYNFINNLDSSRFDVSNGLKYDQHSSENEKSHFEQSNLPFLIQSLSSNEEDFYALLKPLDLPTKIDAFLRSDGSDDIHIDSIKNSLEVSRQPNYMCASNDGMEEQNPMDLTLTNIFPEVDCYSFEKKVNNLKGTDSFETTPRADSIAKMPKKLPPASLLLENSSIKLLDCQATIDDNKTNINSTSILTSLNVENGGNCNRKHESTLVPSCLESMNLSKNIHQNSCILQLDGCTESRLSSRIVNQNEDNLESFRVIPHSANYIPKGNKILPLHASNTKTLLKDHSKSIEANFDHPMNQNLLSHNLEQSDKTVLKTISSSVKLFFHGEADSQYSLDLPLNGDLVCINNYLPISTIYSSTDIAALHIVTSEGYSASLSPYLPRKFRVIPPKSIASIRCQSMTSPILKVDPKHSRFDSVPEVSKNQKIPTTILASKETLKTSSKASDLLSHTLKAPNENQISQVIEQRATPFDTSKEILCDNFSSDCDPNEIENSINYNEKNYLVTRDDIIKDTPPPNSIIIPATEPEIAVEISEAPIISQYSPSSDRNTIRPLFQIDEQCSSTDLTNKLSDVAFDTIPTDSLLPKTRKFRSHSFSTESVKPVASLEGSRRQNFESLPDDKTKTFNLAKGTKNDQIERQISVLLETMPSLICMADKSESKTLDSKNMYPRETSQSPLTQNRSTSGWSNRTSPRAGTPPFTLVPVNGKTTPRPRYHNSNSEIRVYHLSRSNGEAPIKLFVRLVGELGERVMVRVGGGWADLGEYLKEFASHHGRLAVTDTVKLHDGLRRKSSTNTLKSSSTSQNSERPSPYQRPQSVIEQIPKNYLNVTKSRRSSCISTVEIFESKPRYPSTPLPVIKHINYETPPSGNSSNETVLSTSATSEKSSRMSWNEEDFNLGLSGPRGKKTTISDRDLEWIEIMKEKVRLASAEKDRRNREIFEHAERFERRRSRGLSLDGVEKVGRTKRLPKKDDSVVQHSK